MCSFLLKLTYKNYVILKETQNKNLKGKFGNDDKVPYDKVCCFHISF